MKTRRQDAASLYAAGRINLADALKLMRGNPGDTDMPNKLIPKDKYPGMKTSRCWSCSIKKIIEVDKVTIHAGSRTAVEKAVKFGHVHPAIAFDLYGGTTYATEGPALIANEAATKLLGTNITEVEPELPPIGVVEINWPDHDIPIGLNSKKWWKELADKIRTIDGDIIVNCHGGHGRTGTFLAILCTYLNVIPKDQDPVEWVRLKGCPEMVESMSQKDYIEEMTGRKVTAEIDDPWGDYAGSRWTQGGGNDNSTFSTATTGSAVFNSDTWENPRKKSHVEPYPADFDYDNPPAWIDEVAREKLLDQQSLDILWDNFLGGSPMDINDKGLCRWLVRKFFKDYPEGDLFDAWYDTFDKKWTLYGGTESPDEEPDPVG